jgi:hypothetical protein
MGDKNAEFDADFEFVDKVVRKFLRKYISMKVYESYTFSPFSTVYFRLVNVFATFQRI